jgi:hypothetical protein
MASMRLERGEPVDVDAESDHADDATKALASKDLTSLAIAHVCASGSSQRGALDPSERWRESLLDVLRAVEGDGRAAVAGESRHDANLPCRKARRLLVDVDHIEATAAQRSPDRTRVVGEYVGMTPERPSPHEEVVALRVEHDVAAALVPPVRTDELFLHSKCDEL